MFFCTGGLICEVQPCRTPQRLHFCGFTVWVYRRWCRKDNVWRNSEETSVLLSSVCVCVCLCMCV